MGNAQNLLIKLGVSSYTDRHVRNINDFLSQKGTDVKKLLDNLGSWDDADLKIAESWLTEIAA